MSAEAFLLKLAARLDDLRQRPDDKAKWVQGAVQNLEERDPGAFEPRWRRLGLARDVAELAGLSEGDAAAVVLGLFLDSIVDGAEGGDERPPLYWLDYLNTSEPWLEPAIEVAQAVSRGEGAESRPEALGTVVANYHRKITEDNLRPIIALTALQDDPMLEAEQEIADLLWTEEGQALCNDHFDAEMWYHPFGASDVRDALLLLRQRPMPKTPVEAMANVSTPSKNSAEGAVLSDTFEQRRAQLRTPTAAPPPVAAPDEPPEDGAAVLDELRLTGSVVNFAQPEFSPLSVVPEAEVDQANQGGIMETDTRPSPARYAEQNVHQTLEELRDCLHQIGGLTANALELLASLEPGIQHNARVADELHGLLKRLESDAAGASRAA